MQVCFVSREPGRAPELAAAVSAAGGRLVVAAPEDAAGCAKEHGLVLVDDGAARSEEGRIFRQLRAGEGGHQLPLILLATADTPAELIEECWKAGMDDCLVRPLHAGELAARLQALEGAAPGVATSRGVPRVAIAGPDEDLRSRLADLLQHSGYHVFELRSDLPAPRDEAVDALIFADRAGPQIDLAQLGAALKWLSRAHSASPVVIVCAGASGRSLSGGDDPRRLVTVDRALPIDGVLQQVNQLLHRAPSSLRASARLPFFCPVRFREAGVGPGAAWSSGFSYNISTGGLFIKTLVPCRKGACIELRIQLTTLREELAATGVVAWANGYSQRRSLTYPLGMGVQFLGAVSPSLSRLIAACAANA